MRMLARLAILLALLFAGRTAPATAQTLVADLSSHLVAITTNFRGAEVTLFGSKDQPPGDIVVAVRGPDETVTVRRKDRIAGIWLNAHEVAFRNVPSFYALASSRPLEEIGTPALRQLHEIGLENLKLLPVKGDTTQAQAQEYRTALIENRQAGDLYVRSVGRVSLLGPRLFRTTLTFPPQIPTGVYTVQVFLIRDNEVASAQTTPLVIAKSGIGADMIDLAQRHAWLYGMAAVLVAVLAGWVGDFAFRRS